MKIDDLSKAANISFDSAMNLAISLESTGMIRIERRETVEYVPTDEGVIYAQSGLPERQLYNLMPETVSVEELANMHKDAKIAIGWMIKKRWIEIKDGVAYKKDAPIGDDEVMLRHVSDLDSFPQGDES